MTNDQIKALKTGTWVTFPCTECTASRSGVIARIVSHGRSFGPGKEFGTWARVVLTDGKMVTIESDEYIKKFGGQAHDMLGRRIAGAE